ncbi:SRPBCC family protein [Corticicoccus populi]|uniref:SRPBCC family protein n=1 Tax=Corticicoccus populi TaxID=1812821 RepID=A0ABW5WZL0_9STAP
MEIYNYHNKQLDAPPENVFKVVNDDAALKNVFGIIENIEYHSEKRRETGTKFRTTLKVAGKTYAFRSEITDYVEARRIEVKSRLKQGTVVTQFTVVPVDTGSEITVKSHLEGSKKGAGIIVGAMKPIINRVMKKELKKLEEEILNV